MCISIMLIVVIIALKKTIGNKGSDVVKNLTLVRTRVGIFVTRILICLF